MQNTATETIGVGAFFIKNFRMCLNELPQGGRECGEEPTAT